MRWHDEDMEAGAVHPHPQPPASEAADLLLRQDRQRQAHHATERAIAAHLNLSMQARSLLEQPGSLSLRRDHLPQARPDTGPGGVVSIAEAYAQVQVTIQQLQSNPRVALRAQANTEAQTVAQLLADRSVQAMMRTDAVGQSDAHAAGRRIRPGAEAPAGRNATQQRGGHRDR